MAIRDPVPAVASEALPDARSSFRYDAFMSYSHGELPGVATAVQRGLQRFARRAWQPRALRVFRDQTDLEVTAGLWPTLQRKLDDSRFLIVLTSPKAAQSQWVGTEIGHWLSTKDASTIFLVLLEGDLSWDHASAAFDDESTALPVMLRHAFADEPLYVDLRWLPSAEAATLDRAEFRDAIATLAAPIHGRSKRELEDVDVREVRRVRRFRRVAITALVALLIGAAVAAVLAIRERDRAQAQARIATARELAARSAAADDPFVGLVLAIAAEHATDEPLTISRDAFARSAQRLDRLGVWPTDQVMSSDRGLVEGMAWVRGSWRAVLTGGTDALWTSDGRSVVGPVSLDLDDEGSIVTTAWEPAADVIALGTTSGGVMFLDGSSLKVLRSAQVAHVQFVQVLAWSPDGSLLASGGQDGFVQFWDGVDLGLSGPPVEAHDGYVETMAWTRDGTRLVTGGDDGRIVVWDVPTRSVIQTMPSPGGQMVTSVDWSPEGDRVVSTTLDGNIVLWDAQAGTLSHVQNPHPAVPTAVAWSPDGSLIVMGNSDGWIYTWDPVTLDMVGEPIRRDTQAIDVLRWSDDGGSLASMTDNGRSIRVWHRSRDGASIRTDASVRILAVGERADEGGWMLAAADVIEMIASRGGTQPEELAAEELLSWSGQLAAGAWSPDGETLAGIDANDGAVLLWELGQSDEWEPASPELTGATAVTWDPTGSSLALGGAANALMIWSTVGRRVVAESPPRDLGDIQAVAWSPRDDLIATADSEGTVRTWDARTASQDWGWVAHRDAGSAATAVAWSPDASRLASGGSDGEIKLWDLSQRNQVPTAEMRHPDQITGLAWSSDGSVLASVDRSGVLRFWDPRTGAPIGDAVQTTIGVNTIAWSSDGHRLLLAGDAGGMTLLYAIDEVSACRLALGAMAPEQRQDLDDIIIRTPSCREPGRSGPWAALPVSYSNLDER